VLVECAASVTHNGFCAYLGRTPNTLEIGYWTHPAFLRLGVARTAARLLTELAFTVPGIERAGIHHDKANQASAGVPGSSGCQPIGEQPDTPSGPSRARHRLHLAHHAGRMAQRQVMSAA
jgi:RimJ/RimL family protein N-acetyltransferase